jgi:shikimate kinase
MPVINRIPYRNLVLTGFLGVGKTAVGRAISSRLEVEYFDLENEIEMREGISPENIRSMLGEARLRTIEAELVRELALVRGAILVITGPTLLDATNLSRLQDSGPVLCLTASLNEVLRRMHVARGARFHAPDARAVVLGRMKREMRVLSLDLPQLDTTGLSVETVTDRAVDFWMTQADL